MPHSINIRSDHPSSATIRSLWDVCSELETTPSMRSLDYPPHITLAIFDGIDGANLNKAMGAAASGLRPLSITFERIHYFDNPGGLVLWAEPSAPEEILAAHRRLHDTVDPALCRPHYRPGAWIPHCSLATAVEPSRRERAIALANSGIEPFEVVFDVVDCACFYPVEILREQIL